MTSTQQEKPDNEPSSPGFLDIVVLVLSIYVLVVLLVQTIYKLPQSANAIIDRIDFLVCFVFLADFVVRFRKAPSKLAFMRWGWVDLLASIPALESFRAGRLVRVVRVLRAFRSARHLATILFRHRTRSLALTALLSVFVLVSFSTTAVLVFEVEADSNIRTPFDALWWAVSTITTVGYGDKYPVTVEGKVVAMILMIAGVGLFGVLTGLFARLFVEPNLKQEDSDLKALTNEVRLLRERLDEKVGK
jgi:voltage-gated potassium channel